jgi:hypothetical protein
MNITAAQSHKNLRPTTVNSGAARKPTAKAPLTMAARARLAERPEAHGPVVDVVT